MKRYIYLLTTVWLLLVGTVAAQAENEIFTTDDSVYQQGQVLDIIETTYPMMHGREVEYQQLRVELQDGSVRDDIYNDYTPAEVGDRVWVSLWYDPINDREGYFVQDIDRTSGLVWIFIVFAAVYLLIAGVKGLRSLAGLVLAILAVWLVLLPLLQQGYDPLWVGVGISALILGLAMFITHGWTVVSVVSYVGSMIAIVCTVVFASWAMMVTDVSGYVGDSVSTLAILYGADLDIYRLLLAGMIIGILGVLDDVAVMQAAVVREFYSEQNEQTAWDIFVRAMKVGREHAAALVNTLVLAYTAVALPLLLVVFAPAMRNMNEYTVPMVMNVSNELFVIEFIRSIVGSFGLVLTVPIVTGLAVLLYRRYPPKGETAPHVCTHHH